MIRGDQSASVCSPEVIRSKYECSRRGVLTRSPACMPPEPQSCKRLNSLGCEVPLEKPVILCRTLASVHHTSDMTDSAVKGACASADTLVMCTGSAVAQREPDQRGAA